MTLSLSLQLTGHLLDLDHDELRRIQRREADQDIHDSQVDAGLRVVFRVALHEVGLLRRGALERSLQEQALHESADVEPDLAPQAFVVRLEDHPLRAVVQTGFEKQRQPPDGDILPLRAGLVVALQRASAPNDVAINLELAKTVDGLRVEVRRSADR